jgi:hypothetical protein
VDSAGIPAPVPAQRALNHDSQSSFNTDSARRQVTAVERRTWSVTVRGEAERVCEHEAKTIVAGVSVEFYSRGFVFVAYQRH